MYKIVLVVLLSVQNILAISNVKTNPLSISDKPDLKMEEARFSREPIPEYYDRDRPNFVSSYGNSNSYGLKYGGVDRDRYNTNRYGSPSSTLDNKFYMPGGSYNSPPGGVYGPSLSKYPTDSYGHGMSFPPYDLDGQDKLKTLWLPLGAAALVGVAAALIANPMYLNLPALGKRKRRSTDDKHPQKLAYRGHLKN